jgi:GR25 family glycosyltransferase involved in LPS biosynthesis
MQCHVINLATAAARLARFRTHFAANAPPAWTLGVYRAMTPADVVHVPGRIRPTEKACFASHRDLIGRLARQGPATPPFIFEDDAVLLPETSGTLPGYLSMLPPDWDIAFTCVRVGALSQMPGLIDQHRKLCGHRVAAIDLRQMKCFGTSAYLVNPARLGRLREVLDDHTVLDLPYDVFLRRMVDNKVLNGWTCFPFLTSLERVESTVQAPGNALHDELQTVFTRWMSVAGQSADDIRWVEDMAARADTRRRTGFGSLFGMLIDMQFDPDETSRRK